MLSIGSLYIVKTRNRDATLRDIPLCGDVAAITASAPSDGVRLVRTAVDRPQR